jgi:acyl transferase domain-containing protein
MPCLLHKCKLAPYIATIQLALVFAPEPEFAATLYRAGDEQMDPWIQMGGAILVSLISATFSQSILKLRAAAAIGLSYGENNALLAMRAWRDLDALLTDIKNSGMYGHYLTGEREAARDYWKLAPDEPLIWKNYRLAADLDRVKQAIAGEDRVFILIVQGPGDCVIGGDASACQRVIAKIATQCAIPLGVDMVIHTPAMQPFAETWRTVHRRPVYPVPGVRFYTHAYNAAYTIGADATAEALTQQALISIDFSSVVEAAYADGVRVFVEHGPRSVLTSAVKRILADRPHLAVALDRRDTRPLFALTETVLTL